MEQSPRLALSYLQPQQAQKHVTVNETFRRLDALVGLAVKSRSTDAEPASPAEGDAYIMTAGASGAAWSGFAENAVAAFQDGAWAEIAPAEGLTAYVIDEAALVAYASGAWSPVGSGGGTPSEFGVNASPDATNRLAVKSDAVLFSHDDVTPGAGDMRAKLNKASAAKTASVLFQTAFSGRAECGLAGDDHFRIKVSPDNFATTYSAIFIDKDSGRVGFNNASPVSQISVLGAAFRQIEFGLAGATPFGFISHGEIGGTDYFLFDMNRRSYDGTFANTGKAAARIQMTSQNANSEISLLTHNTNNAIPQIRVTVDKDGKVGIGTTSPGSKLHISGGGVQVGAPTGGDKGTGTINAQAVYDDNALLSCYVFDQALDSAIDLEAWDARIGERRHAPLRKFAARLGGAHDPLSLDGYAAHWREKRHLTSMPNKTHYAAEHGLSAGEWIQRLVETVEIQAVLIEELNGRLKAVEAR